MIQQQFYSGFKAIIPITPGILPFGAVMGSVFAEANLSFGQALLMNSTVYAGASQLAAVDLMKLNAAVLVVVATGLIINLRFLLYSAAMAPYLQQSSTWMKFICAFTLTDQGYATISSNFDKFETNADALSFYLGTSACMMITWTGSVIAGFIFGNFAPASLSLDFAVPLSFLALLMPSVRSKGQLTVVIVSTVLSVLFFQLPLKLGTMVTALSSLALAWFLIKKKRVT